MAAGNRRCAPSQTPLKPPGLYFLKEFQWWGRYGVVSTKISSCRWQEKLFKSNFIFSLVRYVKNVNFYFFAIWREKSKVKFPLYLITKPPDNEDVWRGGDKARPLLTSALDRHEWSASRPSNYKPGGKSPWYELCRRLDVFQSLSEKSKNKNLLFIPGIEPWPSSLSPSLYRLCYPGLLEWIFNLL